MMKVVYRKTKEQFDRDSPTDVTFDLKQELRRLQSHNCPAESIAYFKLLSELYDNVSPLYELTNAIIDERMESLADVAFVKNTTSSSTITLREILDVFVSIEFKQFWWVFNLLDYERDMRSDFAYNASIKSIIPDYLLEPRPNSVYDYVCDEIAKVYYHFFRIEIIFNYYFRKKETQDDLKRISKGLALIQQLNTTFAQHLSHVVVIWCKKNFFYFGQELLKIILALIFHLRNSETIKFTINDSIRVENLNQIREIVIEKRDIFKRIGDTTMNQLDEYQICHCPSIKNRFVAYETFKNTGVLWYDIPGSILRINIPMDKLRVDNHVETSYHVKLIPPELREASLTQEMTHENYPVVNIPVEFYNISKILDITGSFGKAITKYFLGKITFDWFGETKTLLDLKVFLPKTLVSIYSLVHYQKFFFKWTISTFYITWLTMFQRKIFESSDFGINSNSLVDSIQSLFTTFETFLSISFPAFCTMYITYFKSIFSLDRSEATFDDLMMIYHAIEKIVITQMKIFFKIINLDNLLAITNQELSINCYESTNNDIDDITSFISDIKNHLNNTKKYLIYLR